MLYYTYILQQSPFFNNLKGLMEDFFCYSLFFLIVASFDSEGDPSGDPSDTDTLVASLPFLFYCTQV
jgi:hypothetical protein